MNELWVPPVCWMVIYRLLIWFFMSNLAFREMWNSLLGRKDSGQVRFLVVWTCTTETFISIKFLKDAGNIQYVATPWYILAIWVSLFSFMGGYYLYLRIFRSQKTPWVESA
jgi:phosphatidylserine synthase 2